jgi:hypothetical protein
VQLQVEQIVQFELGTDRCEGGGLGREAVSVKKKRTERDVGGGHKLLPVTRSHRWRAQFTYDEASDNTERDGKERKICTDKWQSNQEVLDIVLQTSEALPRPVTSKPSGT